MPEAIISKQKWLIELSSFKKKSKLVSKHDTSQYFNTFSHCGKRKRIETKDEIMCNPSNNNEWSNIN